MRRLLIGATLFVFATPASARSMSYVCNGTISHYTLSAYTNIATYDDENGCVFITNSAEGRKILQTCPMDAQCSVEAEVDNTALAYEIYKVKSVRRTDARPIKKSCVVNDPTGTPLNVRSRPNGPILGALNNQTEVFITDMAEVGGRRWARLCQ